MPVVSSPPTSEHIAQLVLIHYGLTAEIKPLPGEVDFNYLIRTDAGERYTLKLSRTDTLELEIAYQAAILNYLAEQALPFAIPFIVPTLNGSDYLAIQLAGQTHWLRLQSWVSGRMLGEVNPINTQLRRQWGVVCGQLSKALQAFDHPYAHRSYKWNPSQTLDSRQYLPYIKDEGEQEIARYFWQLFEEQTLPKLSELRKSVNYNDAHEMNLLASQVLSAPQITGVIDFGDVLYTHTVNELAIAGAYAAMHRPDPLTAVAEVVEGYHVIFPLEAKEVALLYSLIAARLLITVASAAWNQVQEPDNEYLQVSAQPAWDVLKKWRHISPQLAHYTFRNACGWEACPARLYFQQWLNNKQPIFADLIDYSTQQTIALDLSVGSLDLGGNDNFSTNPKFNQTINRILAEQGASVGVGGYLEVRPFYTTDAYAVTGNNGPEWRSVHLGLDVWAVAGTPVYAPLSGMVESLQNNDNDCDYGPTLLLRHDVGDGLFFYTLYGHLGPEVLSQFKVGDTIAQGQAIATIGAPPSNGNWPPHLHFQIILDLLGKVGDFPGVSFPSQRDIWSSICPDPALLFPGLPRVSTQNTNSKKILTERKKILGKSLSLSYQKPLHILRGSGAYLYDENGRRYLDTVNNVAHVGHEHPQVVRAAQRQLALLNTNTRYLHPEIVQYAEELLATFPSELSIVHFVNSGSEANELALRMAKAYSNQHDMLAIEVGYHGNTGGTIDISSYKFDGKGGKGAPPHTHLLPIPDLFRGKHRNPESAGKEYAAYALNIIQQLQNEGKNIAGFIAESILSCGGQIVLPEGYLVDVYRYVRQAGGLCIADEVQVGFGRVGEAFWGFELQGVIPDIVTLGKPIGNGHPLAAVVCTEAVAQDFANGMEYFNTFGGNPVSCAIGRTVLNVIQTEELAANAFTTGNYLKAGLLELQTQFPIIADVRGHGFFLGFELVENRTELTPAAAACSYLANRMRERGILMSTDGPLHNVIKIKPPMCFNRQQADFLLENLREIFAEDMMRVG